MKEIVEFVTKKLSEEGKGLSEDELKALAQKYSEEAFSKSGEELTDDDLEGVAGGLGLLRSRGGFPQAESMAANEAFTEFSTGKRWK